MYIDELIRMLSRERVLVRLLFSRRKSGGVRREVARALVDGKVERLQFLLDHGVIRESTTCHTGTAPETKSGTAPETKSGTAPEAAVESLELEEPYLRFFEEVLDVSEQIRVESVRESIGALEEAMMYYLMEDSRQRRGEYLAQVRGMLRSIGRTTFQNVIDLKRSIDNTYKNEPNFAIKKEKLKRLDEKRLGIGELIRRTETLLDEKQEDFFRIAMDSALNAEVRELGMQLTEAYHNLLDLDRQIIDYLNLIEYQSRLLRKLQRVKYLKDQMVLESQSDMNRVLSEIHPIWMKNRSKYSLKPSLEQLRNSDEGLAALKMLRLKLRSDIPTRRRVAAPIDAAYLDCAGLVMDMVSISELKSEYLAAGGELYAFMRDYRYSRPLEREERLVLFCQIVSRYLPELRLDGSTACDGDIEYMLVYPA